MILKQTENKLKPAARENFGSEKELQTLFESNLENIFGCRFVDTEHYTGTAHGGRIDTLALSEDNNPVIIEYKNVENQGLVLQALFYLDWLKDHHGDFEIAVQKNLGKVEIDWSRIRVLCIAPKFDRYSLQAVKHIGGIIELWEFHRFEDGVIQLEEVYRLSERAETAKAKIPKTATTKSNTEISMSSHISLCSEKTLELFGKIQEFLLGLDENIVEVPLKKYIAYKLAKNVACLELQKKKILVTLPLTYRSNMPKFVRDVSTIGHWGTGDIDMSISNEEQLEQAFDLIRAAHLKTGS